MGERKATTLDSELRSMLAQVHQDNPVVSTISTGKPNRIAAVEESAVWIETEKSKADGKGALPVAAWMLQSAWDHLRSTGSLDNRFLGASDGLNVKRSSAVCALLAHLPGVTVTSSRPIMLTYEKP